MKPRSIAKVIASILWLLAGLVSIATGVDLFSRENLSISVSGNSVDVQLAIGYATAGVLFLFEAALTFYGKRLALILSIPVAILMAVFVVDQLGEFFEGGMVSFKYLSFYGAMLLASTLTTVVVAWFRIGADRTNA